MLNENLEVIGRILEATLENARCEFDSTAEEGEPVSFKVGDEVIRARIDILETVSYSGLIGYISFKDRPTKPPKALTPIYKREEVQTGILNVGTDFRGNIVRLDLNPLFVHLLIGGKPQRGKTHLLIILIEELAKLGVPAIIFDTQGECVNLPEIYKNVIVVEDINSKDLISHLQQRRIIIINLLGEGNAHKAMRLSILLEKFVEAKEKDYSEANNDYRLLNIPPTLIMIDEGDIFSPDRQYRRSRDFDRSTDIIEEIAKRGSKLGIGLIVAVQRINRLTSDVRDNCNSTICFHVTGRSNETALRSITYFSEAAIKKLKSFLVGECIIIGEIGSRTIKTREIETTRSKNTDFEKMLGIDARLENEEEEQQIVINSDGAIIDKQFGKIKTKAQRMVERDMMEFENDGGDGVLTRSTPLSDKEAKEITSGNWNEDDEKLIERLRRLNKDNDIDEKNGKGIPKTGDR